MEPIEQIHTILKERGFSPDSLFIFSSIGYNQPISYSVKVQCAGTICEEFTSAKDAIEWAKTFDPKAGQEKTRKERIASLRKQLAELEQE